MRFPSVGSYLRRWYGPQYLSIGFTFDHGELRLGPGRHGRRAAAQAAMVRATARLGRL